MLFFCQKREAGMEYCDKHKWIEEEYSRQRNDRKFWQRIRDNKLVYFVGTGLILLMLYFIGWTTDSIYAQKANEKENKKVAEVICDRVKTIDEKIEKIQEKREQDQKELMNKLLEIQKQIRR
jgi:hypothetical protein